MPSLSASSTEMVVLSAPVSSRKSMTPTSSFVDECLSSATTKNLSGIGVGRNPSQDIAFTLTLRTQIARYGMCRCQSRKAVESFVM